MTSVDQAFAALADPIRRAMLTRLALGETTVGELGKPFSVSGPAISRHLRVLEKASLIATTRDGKFRRCRLNAPALAEAASWFDQYRQFWEEGLERLDGFLKQQRDD